jgi:MFS family permease
MGIWGIWGCLGSTVAALCTPTVYSKFGFVFLWLSYACVCALAFVVVLIVVKKPSTQSSTEADAASKNAPQPIKYSAMVNKNILLFFIAFAIFNICLLAVLSFVPTILQMQGFDSTLSGFLSTLPMLLSIVSAPLFGSISDKINKVKPLLVLAVFVMGPCTFLMYTFTIAILWIAAVIMGLIGMGCVGIFLAGYMKILPSPEYASVGMGVMICVQGIGQFLGTFLVQFLLGPDLTSWTFAGIVLMILGLIGTACLALCKIDK